jgi:hypothetical protein
LSKCTKNYNVHDGEINIVMLNHHLRWACEEDAKKEGEAQEVEGEEAEAIQAEK